MLIFAYLFKIHCVYIFFAPRTNNGVLFVNWLMVIKQFAFALSKLAKMPFEHFIAIAWALKIPCIYRLAILVLSNEVMHRHTRS